MSGVEAVSAMSATASIALQLAEAAVKLHIFLKTVRDAPKSEGTCTKTQKTGIIPKASFTEDVMLPGPREALPTYGPLLGCRRNLDELRALAKELHVRMRWGKYREHGKPLRLVFEKDLIDEFRRNLESRKWTIIL